MPLHSSYFIKIWYNFDCFDRPVKTVESVPRRLQFFLPEIQNYQKLYLTDCFVKNKCTTNRAPIISNETKLKSIFIRVLVDSLDILGFEWQSMRLFWQLRSLCWLISSKTYSRNIFIDFLLEAALTVAFFVWPVATIYTLTAVKFWFVRSTWLVNSWPMLLLLVKIGFD